MASAKLSRRVEKVVEQLDGDGPYWARTSDLRLVEPALSQLS
jgi:hypothetical protein